MCDLSGGGGDHNDGCWCLIMGGDTLYNTALVDTDRKAIRDKN